jgi:ATP-dependent DNA helicase PIF1
MELANYVRTHKKYLLRKLCCLKLLIIDEISMIDADLLTKISEFLRIIRQSTLAFGGVQIVLCGDMTQMSPVRGKYCFHSPEWSAANIEVVELTEIIRQDKDKRFRDMLEELRWGMCNKEHLRVLKSLKHTKFKNGIEPTILYSINADVDAMNASKFQALVDNGAVAKSYKTKYSSNAASKAWAAAIKLPDELVLCEGAQVVLTWNLSQDTGLVNGSRGVVTELTATGPRVRFMCGTEVIIDHLKMTQDDDDETWLSFIPLRLAYALTIHKSQGMTLDAIVLDLGESIFEYGQAYTALSRARNLESVRVLSVKASSFKTHKDVLEFYGKNKQHDAIKS